MQSLFALQQCKEADYQLARDFTSKKFEPDLNSMEVQDKTVLAQKRTQAQKLFETSFHNGINTIEHEDVAIENTINEAIALYHKQCKKDTDFFMKGMIAEIEKIYVFYIAVLSLAKEFAEIAKADKKVSHANFVQNAWLRALVASEQLEKEQKRLNYSWDKHTAEVKQWFRDVVRQDSEYLTYLDKKNPTADEQKKFANHLFRKIILGKNSINDYFEEEVLRWAEDKEIVKGLVEKTIKSFNPKEQTALSLHTLSVNWDEDKEFVEKLYLEAARLDPSYAELIAQNTRNWEVDRLPLTDRVIIEMAIAELLSFPNIPVKVTINEYIELAKDYSTPKSRQFINGILDVIARELKEKGVLKKSGRGLIDNK